MLCLGALLEVEWLKRPLLASRRKSPKRVRRCSRPVRGQTWRVGPFVCPGGRIWAGNKATGNGQIVALTSKSDHFRGKIIIERTALGHARRCPSLAGTWWNVSPSHGARGSFADMGATVQHTCSGIRNHLPAGGLVAQRSRGGPLRTLRGGCWRGCCAELGCCSRVLGADLYVLRGVREQQPSSQMSDLWRCPGSPQGLLRAAALRGCLAAQRVMWGGTWGCGEASLIVVFIFNTLAYTRRGSSARKAAAGSPAAAALRAAGDQARSCRTLLPRHFPNHAATEPRV